MRTFQGLRGAGHWPAGLGSSAAIFSFYWTFVQDHRYFPPKWQVPDIKKWNLVFVLGLFLDARAVDLGVQDKQQTHYKMKITFWCSERIPADKSLVKPFESWLTPKIGLRPLANKPFYRGFLDLITSALYRLEKLHLTCLFDSALTAFNYKNPDINWTNQWDKLWCISSSFNIYVALLYHVLIHLLKRVKGINSVNDYPTKCQSW